MCIFEHLQGWQISQANRADVFSATPVNRDDNDKGEIVGSRTSAGQKTLFNRAAGAGVATTSLSSFFIPPLSCNFLVFFYHHHHSSQSIPVEPLNNLGVRGITFLSSGKSHNNL